MPVRLTEEESVFIIQPEGPVLALDSHAEIRETFKGLQAKDPQGVVLDLSEIDRIDSLGLGALISGRLSLRGKCEIQLCGLSHQVETLIRHSRMDLLFPIHDSRRAAVSAAKAAKKQD